jgi:S1-C subfamily serine protease
MNVAVQTGEQPDRLMWTTNRRPPANPSVPTPQTPPAFPGMTLQESSEGAAFKGVLITEVAEGTAASVVGLQPGDVVIEAGGKPVRTKADLDAVLGEADMSRGVMIFIEREGQRTFKILKQ